MKKPRVLAQDGLSNPAVAPSVADMAKALLSPNTPKNEALTPSAGDGVQASRDDHQHPRLTSTTYATLDNNGQATVTFSRTFVNKPGLNLTETDATTATQPLVLRGLSWTMDAQGRYAGVVIQGRRAQMLPTINPLTGALTLLTQVVTGVNGVIAALTNYDVFGGSAAGSIVSVIAIARSDVPST